MSLPNTDFTPPNYRIAKICRNCFYYSAAGTGERGRLKGTCRLPKVADPTAPARPTHGTCSCDAHIFKNKNHVNKINHDYNTPLPDDREI